MIGNSNQKYSLKVKGYPTPFTINEQVKEHIYTRTDEQGHIQLDGQFFLPSQIVSCYKLEQTNYTDDDVMYPIYEANSNTKSRFIQSKDQFTQLVEDCKIYYNTENKHWEENITGRKTYIDPPVKKKSNATVYVKNDGVTIDWKMAKKKWLERNSINQGAHYPHTAPQAINTTYDIYNNYFTHTYIDRCNLNG